MKTLKLLTFVIIAFCIFCYTYLEMTLTDIARNVLLIIILICFVCIAILFAMFAKDLFNEK